MNAKESLIHRRYVYVVWHVHDLGDGDEDAKLVGCYSSRGLAETAIRRLSRKPGFVRYPEGFLISRYAFNEDHWTAGFKTVES